jgi:hypothetical protein
VHAKIDGDEKDDVAPDAAYDDERHSVPFRWDPLEENCEECVDGDSL